MKKFRSNAIAKKFLYDRLTTEMNIPRLYRPFEVERFKPSQNCNISNTISKLTVIVLMGSEMENVAIVKDIIKQSFKRVVYVLVSPISKLPTDLEHALNEHKIEFIPVQDKGIGPAAARNLAMNEIKDSFIVFMEAGVRYNKSYLCYFAQGFLAFPDVNLFFSDYQTIDSNGITTFQLTDFSTSQFSEWLPSSRTLGIRFKNSIFFPVWPEYLDYHGDDTVWIAKSLHHHKSIVFIDEITASWIFDPESNTGKTTANAYAFGDGQAGIRDHAYIPNALAKPWSDISISYWRGFADRPRLDKKRGYSHVKVVLTDEANLTKLVKTTEQLSIKDDCRVILVFTNPLQEHNEHIHHPFDLDSTTIIPMSFTLLFSILEEYSREGFQLVLVHDDEKISRYLVTMLQKNISNLTTYSSNQ